MTVLMIRGLVDAGPASECPYVIPPMSDPEFIVEQLVAVRPDGSRFDVVLRVGKPYADNGPHSCVVQLSPLDHKPVRICGEGPMQALFLGLRFIRLRLVAEEEDRGIRFFGTGDGAKEPMDWRHFWYGEPAQSEAG
jgi:hypothetical protein